jgi:hypothetical protein
MGSANCAQPASIVLRKSIRPTLPQPVPVENCDSPHFQSYVTLRTIVIRSRPASTPCEGFYTSSDRSRNANRSPSRSGTRPEQRAISETRLDEIGRCPADGPRGRGGCMYGSSCGAPLREPHGFAGCRECRHQVEPASASLFAAEGGASADPAEMARRVGPETPVPEWRKRLVCSRRGSHEIKMVLLAPCSAEGISERERL